MNQYKNPRAWVPVTPWAAWGRALGVGREVAGVFCNIKAHLLSGRPFLEHASI